MFWGTICRRVKRFTLTLGKARVQAAGTDPWVPGHISVGLSEEEERIFYFSERGKKFREIRWNAAVKYDLTNHQ